MEKKIYRIEIEETLTKVIQIEATNEGEAFVKATEMYRNEDIILMADDDTNIDINIYILDDNGDRIGV